MTYHETYEDEFYDLPRCKLCGSDIMTFDPTVTAHEECQNDADYIESVALSKMPVTEWLLIKNDPDLMIEFLEGLI